MPIDTTTPRRGFLGTMATAVAAASLPWWKSEARGARSSSQDVGPDDFLEGLNGTHKCFYDIPNVRGGRTFVHARNYMRALTQTFGAAQSDVDVLITLYTPDATSTQPLAFTDTIWEKYRVGEFMGLADRETGRPFTRNVFHRPQPGDPVGASMGIAALQEQGLTFLTCANSTRAFAGALAGAGRGEGDVIHADLLANILPGVILVPAMVVAVARAQAHGFAYKRE